MPSFGTLTKTDLRDGWPGEASDFTPWLADNLTLLGDALGMDLELVAQESPVGSFSLDLLARDIGRDRPVIIENQLETTDHDHLGKLLTYAAGHDAAVAVWVTANFREEHRQALDWLNQRTYEDTEFFGIVVELLRIDDSPVAPSFRLVAFPNGWSKATKASPGSVTLTERKTAYRSFFQSLIDELRDRYAFTNARVGQPQGWYVFRSGHTGVWYAASFPGGDQVRAEVSLDGKTAEQNKWLFDQLRSDREQIEQQFGAPLSWERMDNRKRSRIAIYRSGSIMADEGALSEIQEWLVQNLLKLKAVFGPRLTALVKNEAAPDIQTEMSEDDTATTPVLQ